MRVLQGTEGKLELLGATGGKGYKTIGNMAPETLSALYNC